MLPAVATIVTINNSTEARSFFKGANCFFGREEEREREQEREWESEGVRDWERERERERKSVIKRDW